MNRRASYGLALAGQLRFSDFGPHDESHRRVDVCRECCEPSRNVAVATALEDRDFAQWVGVCRWPIDSAASLVIPLLAGLRGMAQRSRHLPPARYREPWRSRSRYRCHRGRDPGRRKTNRWPGPRNARQARFSDRHFQCLSAPPHHAVEKYRPTRQQRDRKERRGQNRQRRVRGLVQGQTMQCAPIAIDLLAFGLSNSSAVSPIVPHLFGAFQEARGPGDIKRLVGKLFLALLILLVRQHDRLPSERLCDPLQRLRPALARLRNSASSDFVIRAKGSAGMSRPSRRRSRASDNLVP